MTRANSSQEGQQTCAAAGSCIELKIHGMMIAEAVCESGREKRAGHEEPHCHGSSRLSEVSVQPANPTPGLVGLLGGLAGKIRLIPSGCQSAKGFLV